MVKTVKPGDDSYLDWMAHLAHTRRLKRGEESALPEEVQKLTLVDVENNPFRVEFDDAVSRLLPSLGQEIQVIKTDSGEEYLFTRFGLPDSATVNTNRAGAVVIFNADTLEELLVVYQTSKNMSYESSITHSFAYDESRGLLAMTYIDNANTATAYGIEVFKVDLVAKTSSHLTTIREASDPNIDETTAFTQGIGFEDGILYAADPGAAHPDNNTVGGVMYKFDIDNVTGGFTTDWFPVIPANTTNENGFTSGGGVDGVVLNVNGNDDTYNRIISGQGTDNKFVAFYPEDNTLEWFTVSPGFAVNSDFKTGRCKIFDEFEVYTHLNGPQFAVYTYDKETRTRELFQVVTLPGTSDRVQSISLYGNMIAVSQWVVDYVHFYNINVEAGTVDYVETVFIENPASDSDFGYDIEFSSNKIFISDPNDDNSGTSDQGVIYAFDIVTQGG